MNARVRTLGLLLFAAFLAATPLVAQKGTRSSGSSGGNSGKVLAGGTGSSHKGGHYVRSGPGDLGIASPSTPAPRLSSAPSVELRLPATRARVLSGDPRAGLPSYSKTAPSVSTVRAPQKPSSPKARAAKVAPAPGGRDAKGRITRSADAKRQFEKQSGHLNGWPGHVVDHIGPLACGGADSPSNMQWQTTAEGKAKDKVERTGCGKPK